MRLCRLKKRIQYLIWWKILTATTVTVFSMFAVNRTSDESDAHLKDSMFDIDLVQPGNRPGKNYPGVDNYQARFGNQDYGIESDADTAIKI